MNDILNLNAIQAIEIAHRLGLRQGQNSKTFHCFRPELHANGDQNPSLVITEKGFRCYACGIWGGKLDQPRNVVNYYRPVQWQPGEIIRDDYDINLNPVTPTGMYHIRIGVKTPEQDMFWPASGAALQQERAILTDVYIEND